MTPMTTTIRNTVLALIAAGGLAIGATACVDDDEETTPAPGGEAPQEETPRDEEPSEDQERDDLISFELDDRSSYGIKDIWVKYTITNHSSEKSSYEFDWEAVNDKGVRVDDGWILVDNVRPGQTVRGEDFTLLETMDVTLNITSFDRYASF
jgi:hypothetical protein